jgi:SPX domain protein involved in polyphosphate accumulation
MKFGLYLEENRIAEWKEFYINYELLKSFLKPFQIRYKKRQADFNKKKSGNRSFFFDQRSNSLNSLSDIQIFPNQNEKALLEKFGIQIILELKKVDFFFYQKVKTSHDRIKEIKEQLEFSEENREYERFNVQ